MRPLSVFAFIKGNIPKLLPMVITVCLAVTVLYFMAMFTEQINTGVKEVSIYPLEKMSIIQGDKSGISKEDINSLTKNIWNSKIFAVDCLFVTYHNIVGYTSAVAIMSQQKDIESLMKIQGFSLIGGKLPIKPLEIVIHKKLAKDYGLNVGSIIKKDSKGWNTDKDLKVAGIFDGKAVTAIGVDDNSSLIAGNPHVSLIIAGNQSSLQIANNFIEKNLSNKYSTLTIKSEQDFIVKFNGPIKALELFIGLVLLSVIGVFLSNITSIQYSLRKKELELLNAIGYTRKYIIKKSLKEIGIAAGLGYISGIMIAIILGWVINICILNDKGMNFTLFLGDSMLYTLIVPLGIILFSIRAPLKLTRFRDLA